MKLWRSILYIGVGYGVGLVVRRWLAAEPPTTEALPPVTIEIQVVDKTAVPQTTTAVLPAPPTAVDDLTRIKGIGPTYARRLQEAGIRTFAALAQQPPATLRQISGLQPWQAADPADWIAQAAEWAAQ